MTKKGFTLIEVMIVAVIVAILSAVAIPAYNRYIERSSNNVATNTAGTIAASIGVAITESAPGFVAISTHGIGGGVLQIANDISVMIPSEISVSYGGGTVTASHVRGSGVVTVNYWYF